MYSEVLGDLSEKIALIVIICNNANNIDFINDNIYWQ